MANRAELLRKIQARKAEKQAAEKAKWSKMRQIAAEGAVELEKKLAKLRDLCVAAAEGFENLSENLDLIQAPKDASLKARTAAARNYAKSFKRIAEEQPEMLAEAVQEAYKSLDEIAGTLEMAADSLGVDLNATPAEEAFAGEGMEELQHGEAEGEAIAEGEMEEGEAEKDAAGGDWFVTDRDESGQPKPPEKIDVPRVANSGPGAAGFVTDRNNDGKPETPKKMDIPQAQGEAQTSIKDASKKRADNGAASPEAFVKDIPQAQGKTEVGAGKAGRVRPRTQIVSPGTPQAPGAEEFVKNIPQSQGKSEAAGNNAKSAARR